MSGTACSFWQKVLMAALSKVLVQVTVQSILRWMRARERVTQRARDSNRKVISTFKNELPICNSSSRIAEITGTYRHCRCAEVQLGRMKILPPILIVTVVYANGDNWVMCIIISCCLISSIISCRHSLVVGTVVSHVFITTQRLSLLSVHLPQKIFIKMAFWRWNGDIVTRK